jgi:uncharacterized DUF497 family protein
VEWDAAKSAANEVKHGLSFQQASQLFLGDADYVEIYDEASSIDEDRFIAIGPIQAGVIIVAFTERSDDVIRIISARKATRREVGLFRAHGERQP